MIVATALYVRRDYVARELANSALSETDLEVAELSVTSLGVSRVELSRLEIVSGNGNRFVIRGLSVPLSLSGDEINEIFADSLEVEFSPDRTERQALSDSLWKLLALPTEQPDIVVSVDTIALPDLPVVQNAIWKTIGDRQSAKLKFDEHVIEIAIDGRETEGYRISLRGNEEEISAQLGIASVEGDAELSGDLRLRIGDWLPTLRSLALLPEGLESVETEVSGAITIALDSDEPGHIAVGASLSPSNGADIRYAIADDAELRFDASASEAMDIQFDYPNMTWTANSESIDGLVTIEASSFPLLLNNLECQSGIRCTMYATIYGEGLSWADYAVDTASISSPVTVETGETTRIDLSTDASVVLTGIQVGEIAVASAEVLSFSGTQVLVGDTWQNSVDEVRLAVDGLEVARELSTSGEFVVTGLTIADSGETVDAEVSLSQGASATWDELLVSLPGVSGTVTRRGDELRTSLIVRNAAVEAGIEMIRNFETGAGAVSVRDARVSFDYAHLSDYVSDWPFIWDVMSGVLTADVSLDWQATDAGLRYGGTAAANLQKLSGIYEDYAFVGVTTALQGTFDSNDGVVLEPSSVNVPLIDVGLPVRNLTADYRVSVDAREVSVENLSMDALGGTVTARPFSYTAGAEHNEIVFDTQAIQLALIADLAEFEALEMNGSISGEIPVTFGTDSIIVDGGQLASDDPGGVIRYSSSLTEGASPDGNLAIVSRALSNFEFDELSSTVDYGDDGELVLTTRLSGINPDTDPNQPIILNLNVDTNIPQMLRSLRAIRTIEDILEERTAE